MMEHKISNPNKPVNSAIFYQETGCTLFMRDADWFIGGDVTAQEAKALLEAHNPPAHKEPTVAEKLATVGLSIDDLRAALGV
jgi:hypothetical protein